MQRSPQPGTVDATDRRCPAAARALLAHAVDYAGLFPPAALPMSEAVAEYAAADGGPDAWMLGHFVVPAVRLAEFAAEKGAAGHAAVWTLSAIVRDGSEADRTAVTAFNADARRHRAVVDTIESKPATLEGIDWLAEAFGATFEVYVEVAAGDDASRWLERVRDRGLSGKVRTGGLTADAFPASAALLGFIDAALRLQVPFKATAGLHHAARGSYRLSYEAGSASAPMYGYLNVLVATAALEAGLPMPAAEWALWQAETASLRFSDASLRWGDIELPLARVRDTRQRLVSFGSCSFREPAGEFRALASGSVLAVPASCFLIPAS